MIIPTFTPSHIELIRHLLNPEIAEATQDDSGQYWVYVKRNAKYIKLFWTEQEVKVLVEAEYFLTFSNRWNRDHMVVVINPEYESELKLLVMHKDSRQGK